MLKSLTNVNIISYLYSIIASCIQTYSKSSVNFQVYHTFFFLVGRGRGIDDGRFRSIRIITSNRKMFFLYFLLVLLLFLCCYSIFQYF